MLENPDRQNAYAYKCEPRDPWESKQGTVLERSETVAAVQVSITMAPLTPFLTETMFQNLRRSLPEGSPLSVHFAQLPPAEEPHDGDAQIEESVQRMQIVLELGRTAREKLGRPLRTPLKGLTIAHAEPAVLADLTGASSSKHTMPSKTAFPVAASDVQKKKGLPDRY